MAAGLGLAACTTEDAGPAPGPTAREGCHSFRTEDGFESSTQTFSVAVDAAAGRAYATGLGLPVLSVIDLATPTRVDGFRFSREGTRYPQVVVTDAGAVWVASQSSPGLVRVDVTARTGHAFDGFPAEPWAVGLAEDVLAQRDDQVVRVKGDGTLAAKGTIGPARAAARHPDGVIVVAGEQGSVLDADTLAVKSTCTLPFAPSEVAALDDGTVIVADLDHLGRLRCTPDAPAESWTLGTDIHALVAHGAEALAVDRVGPDDPTRGVTWRIGPTGEPALAFATAKNTASGGFDADGGFWGNSEGSSEVVGWNAADGTELAEVSTGTSVADLVVSPEGVVYGTGRLSALVGRLDGDTVTRGEPLVWPWAPQLDGDRLVMVDHLEGRLATVDATTLTRLSAIDLGYGPNLLLTFDSLAPAPDRGTWLLAESQADVLLEVDVDAGQIVNRWPLPGPPVADAHQAAQLELQYRDGVAFLARTSDGRLTRLDLATGERTDGWLGADDTAALQAVRQTRATQPDGDHIWVGPLRVDPDTLTVDDRWPEVERLLVPWPDAPGEWLAMDAAGLDLVRVDTSGGVTARLPWFDEEEPGTVAALDPDGRRVWVNRSYEGTVCEVALAAFDDDATRTDPPD